VDVIDGHRREALDKKKLEQKISKRTRRNDYYEYLVKWKDHIVEDVSWLNEEGIQHGKEFKDIMENIP